MGLEYLRSAAEQTTVPSLVDSIASALPGGRGALDRADEDELRELVTLLMSRDFEEERTVPLQGWIVSTAADSPLAASLLGAGRTLL
jgi:hypothetical protein